MKTIKAEQVTDNLVFPEGPRWRDGSLYFSDFIDQRISKLDPATGELETVVQLSDAPSGLGWRPDGTLLFVSMARQQLCALTEKGPEVVAELGDFAGGRTNDMAVDAKGGAYIGNFGFDMMRGAPARTTSLIYVSPEGKVRHVADELMFPNGIVLTDEGRTLIVAETYANRLSAYEVASDGSLSDRRTFAQFGQDVAPDGISVNSEGAVWVATARDNRCVCVKDGGEVIAEVLIGEGQTYACMLGGENESDLYICGSSGFRPAPGEREGRIWRARVA